MLEESGKARQHRDVDQNDFESDACCDAEGEAGLPKQSGEHRPLASSGAAGPASAAAAITPASVEWRQQEPRGPLGGCSVFTPGWETLSTSTSPSDLALCQSAPSFFSLFPFYHLPPLRCQSQPTSYKLSTLFSSGVVPPVVGGKRLRDRSARRARKREREREKRGRCPSCHVVIDAFLLTRWGDLQYSALSDHRGASRNGKKNQRLVLNESFTLKKKRKNQDLV